MYANHKPGPPEEEECLLTTRRIPFDSQLERQLICAL